MSHLYFFIKKSGFHRFRVALTHSVRCAGGWCWSGVRKKYCWLAGGWRLLLELCERKIVLAGWSNQTANRVTTSRNKCVTPFPA